MRRLLLAIAIVLLFSGCYSPTNVTPAPEPPQTKYVIPEPTPIPKMPPVSTYTASDYSYSFNYPGDWGDVTKQVAPLLKGILTSSSGPPDLNPDIVLGLFPDDYHCIFVVCYRYPTGLYPYLKEANLGNTEYISGKESLVGTDDFPKSYFKTKFVYLLTSNEVLMFVVDATGEQYYNIFDNTYSTFINSLQVR